MSSAMSLFAVFSIIVFLGGCAFGALALFVVSIHHAGYRTPIYEIGTHKRGSVSRCVLMTTRIKHEENGQ
jgi:hypothetical protein